MACTTLTFRFFSALAFCINRRNAFFLADGLARWVVVADEIKVNIKKLLAVDGSSACGFVNLNSVNKSVEHSIRQFGTILVFLNKGDKAVCFCFLGSFNLNLTFQLRNTPFKKYLFFIVLLYHSLNLSLRQ